MSWQDPDKEDTTIYNVVVNHEKQYSIWPEYKEFRSVGRMLGKSDLKPKTNGFFSRSRIRRPPYVCFASIGMPDDNLRRAG
jgi:uncharacterized protein YbdZ (MbtH family)